jgi:hypothetical protein
MYRFNHIVNASSVCIRKKLLEKLLPNILSFSLCGDWMLWVLALKSGKAAYLPLGLNYFRVHSDTVRANSEGNLSIFYENLSIAALIYRDKPTKELKRKISGYLNYIYFHRYNAKLRKGDFFQFLSKIKFLGLSACIEALKNKTIYG